MVRRKNPLELAQKCTGLPPANDARSRWTHELGTALSRSGKVRRSGTALQGSASGNGEAGMLWPNRAPLASTSIWVAKFYVSQRRDAEAEPHFRRTLEILESEESRAHSYLPRHLADFAKFYQDQEKNEAAEELYLRALALSEKTHGPESTLTVHAMYELAGFYRATGRYAEALRQITAGLWRSWRKLQRCRRPSIPRGGAV